MSPPDTDTVFTALRAADPDVMDRDELAVLTGQLAAHQAWCDALKVRVTRRQRQLAAEGRAEPARDLLSRHGRQSSKDAKAAADREQVCTSLPSFEDALTAGAVSAGHVDAIANATRNLDDELLAEFHACQADLLADASRQGVDVFERGCRDLAKHLVARSTAASDADELDQQRQRSTVKRWVDKPTGMCHTHLELDPRPRPRPVGRDRLDTGQAPSTRRQPAHTLAPTRSRRRDRRDRRVRRDRVPEIIVTDRPSTHCSTSAHADTICETDNGIPLPISTVRRLCCDAEILPVVLGGRGEALDVGRSNRTATRAQRRALRAMHRTCAHPECTVTFDACRIHHVTPWLRPARRHRHRQPAATVRNTSPQRPRRRLGADDDTRPDRHLDPTRRHPPPHRPHHRPGNTGRRTSAIDSTPAADLNRRVVHNATHRDPVGAQPSATTTPPRRARDPLASGQSTRVERPVRSDLSGVTMEAWETIRSIVSIGWNAISLVSNSKSAS